MSTPIFSYASAAAAVACATIFLVAYRDYRAYVALGPHGLPDNFWGWYKQLKMSRIARKDITVPAPYDLKAVKDTAGPNATTSYLTKPLERRSGQRPTVPNFTAPQRQITATASTEMKLLMNQYIESLVKSNDDTLQLQLSHLEGPVPALQLKDGINRPPYLNPTRGELAHVHPPDGSTHLVLSLEDSKTVIERGWGQRHRLSGSLIGWGYTLVYAPRDQEEFRTWKNIVYAAACYCCAEISDIKEPL
ncbi:phospholipase/carboxylesterase [Pochonia chlamydosporia 170]|uniref:Phospholipase/carboxylesterase n=1 Tax=Pochonia chlamydosporia 170 TaxID=1380566 RepID=A0A179F312_METCM|nr:phospholipase/carboxylesterase [Pochonia chlamydosporia 170]OAQ59543.1 phospholipase/carboxylesterase [Pochonia chlamydosporia 170]